MLYLITLQKLERDDIDIVFDEPTHTIFIDVKGTDGKFNTGLALVQVELLEMDMTESIANEIKDFN